MFFVWGLSCLFAGMSLSGSDEAPSRNGVLSRKEGGRVAYKDHLSKLERDITMFLNKFEPGNLLHISKQSHIKIM